MDRQQRLKILEVASHSNVTRGGAVQMILLARGLQDRGHEVHCVFNAPAKVAGEQRATPTQPHRFDLAGWRDMLRFRAWVRSERFDVIHSHRDTALRFCFLSTLGLRIPAFVTQRGTVYRLPRRGVVRWAFRSRKLDRVIAVAETVRQALIEREGLAPDKVSVVYGGYDPERFHRGVSGESVRREFGLAAETPLVGIVGALVGKKGHADFFEAAARVAERLPTARFVVVGSGKPARFGDLLKRLNLSDRVIFAGHRSDTPEVLAAINVLVCASTKGEGLTGVLREAMAVGTPVVTTDVGGNTELVLHEKTGLVVPVGSSAGIAEAAVRLLRHPDEAARLSAAGEEHVRRLCLNSSRCERIEGVYREIIEGKRQP
jgi:glycosyltransferase involved in cell wall biosynthesis